MAAEPATGEEGTGAEAPQVDPVIRRSRIVAAAFTVASAVAEFVAAYLEPNLILAALWVLLGALTVVVAFYLFRGKFNAWGMAIILNAFALIVAVPQLDFVTMAVLAAQDVGLYVVRLQFGVGAWEIQADKENEEARKLVDRRTANPSGLRCPKCGSDQLWVADDGSAFCLACQTGTIEIARGGPS